MGKEGLSFGGGIRYWGVAGAVAICLGVPFITLRYGSHLPSGIQLTIVILALLAGGIVGAIAVFFGIVIPQHISDATHKRRHGHAPDEAESTPDDHEDGNREILQPIDGDVEDSKL